METKKICLCEDLIFHDFGVNQRRAMEALEKVVKTPAAEFVDFYVHGGAVDGGWQLRGRIKALTQPFLSNPDAWVIEV